MPEQEINDTELEFYATKLYLSKIAEKYKNRGYREVFLEWTTDYIWELKNISRWINEQNDALQEIIEGMTNWIWKISKMQWLDSKIKKKLVENNIYLYAKFVNFVEKTIKNEGKIIDVIDKFRRIEQEIDIKNRALTRYWFDKEMKNIFEWLVQKQYKEISMIIFDMNNLKGINENHWHQTWAEAIYKFWTILKEELNNSWIKYLLSNYFWWDEWFLCLVDVNKKNSVSLVKRFFQTINSNKYKIREVELKLWSCAWIVHYHPMKNTREFLSPKNIIAVADTLVLQSKIRKSKNKTWNAYKILNVTSMKQDEINSMTKKIQTIPRKLNKNTLIKKKLVELFKARKKQNELIMIARTLWVKKILRYNIDLINEIIWNKIIESISNVLIDTKKQTHKKVEKINKKLSSMIIWELEKVSDNITLNPEQKTEFINKLINSNEFQRFSNNEIESIYENHAFELWK